MRYIHVAEKMGKAVDRIEQNATLEDLFWNVFGIMPPPPFILSLNKLKSRAKCDLDKQTFFSWQRMISAHSGKKR